MAEDKSKQTVIIKRVKKGDHAAHGGAWKIAYADFVTAMMAFFLLLWLLNSVTQEQLEGISNYFAPVSISGTTSGAGDILGGKTMTEEGVALSTTSRDIGNLDLPTPKAGKWCLRPPRMRADWAARNWATISWGECCSTHAHCAR